MCVSVQEAGEEVQGADQDGQHQEQLHHRLPLHPCLHLVRHPQVWWVLPTSLLAALVAMVRHYVNRFAKKMHSERIFLPNKCLLTFLLDPSIPGVRSMGPSL